MLKYNYQKGGSILGQGSYGLIIHPSLTCGNLDYSNKDGFVSKIIDSSDISSEYTDIISRDALNITEVDPSSQYLLYPISTCGDIQDFQDKDMTQLKRYLSNKKRGSKAVPARKLSNKSDIIRLLNRNYSNIVMPKGEFDLNSSENVKKIPINHLTHGIVNIIMATKKMSQNRIAHRDIKPLNIIYHQNTLKLIDFGLSIKNKADNIWREYLFETVYIYWSLDYKIIEQFWKFTGNKKTSLYIPNQLNKKEMPKIMKSIYGLVNKFFDDLSLYGINTDKILSKSKCLVELTNYLTSLMKMYNNNLSNKTKIMNEYARCVYNLDTFSLAISIFQIVENSNLNDDIKLVISEILKKYLHLNHNKRSSLNEMLVDICNFFITLRPDQFNLSQIEREIISIFGEDIYSQINIQ
tara:strand:+ start:682 stop:1908 length:1227 start_codon:yes stop_codon:yes gene_type:complete